MTLFLNLSIISGYAYGFPGREESNKEMNWDDAPESYCKTLTKIAYNEDDEPEFWGFTAWKEMLDDCDEDRVLRLFEFFKMGLFTDDPSSLQLTLCYKQLRRICSLQSVGKSSKYERAR